MSKEKKPMSEADSFTWFAVALCLGVTGVMLGWVVLVVFFS